MKINFNNTQLKESTIEDDKINHLSSYAQKIECANYIELHEIDFYQSNAIKYLIGLRHTKTPIDDLKKAQAHVNRLIQIQIEKKGTEHVKKNKK